MATELQKHLRGTNANVSTDLVAGEIGIAEDTNSLLALFNNGSTEIELVSLERLDDVGVGVSGAALVGVDDSVITITGADVQAALEDIDTTLNSLTASTGGFTAGSVNFADSSGDITEDNANFFWDDTLNRLGLGTASPGVNLHVLEGGTPATGNASTVAIFQNTTDATTACDIAIISGATSGISSISFGDSDPNIGRIRYQHGSNSMEFYTLDIERLRIASDGKVGINTPGATVDFHVNAIGGTATAGNAATVAIFQNTTDTTAGADVAIIAGNITGVSSVSFGDLDVKDIGQLKYLHASNSLEIYTGGNLGFTMDGNQDCTFTADVQIDLTLDVTGVVTLTAQPILLSLSTSQAVFTDGSSGLVSNAITGTGNVVMSASPTLTGTIIATSQTLSGTLGVTGTTTIRTTTVSGNISGVGSVVTVEPDITVASIGPRLSLMNINTSATGSIITNGGTITYTSIASLDIAEPVITNNGSNDTIDAATTVRIANAPTEGTVNYALWVDAGNVQFDGNLIVDGTLDVGGALTATGLITANGGVTLGAGDDLIGSSTSDITFTTKFTVAGDTGNTVINGSLDVDGIVKVGNTIDGAVGLDLFITAGSDLQLSAGSEVRSKKAFVTEEGRAVNTTRVTSGTYTALFTDHVIYADTDGGAFTINLPIGLLGVNYKIINVGSSANDLTVAPNGAETINGAASSITVTDGNKVSLIFETTEGWW